MTDRIDQAVVPATGVVGRREFVASFAAGMIAMLATSKVVAQNALALHDLPFGILSRMLTAYIYGYAPVAAWATERIQTAVPDANTVGGRAPVNQFAYSKKLATPSATTVVRPNADTIYTLAWLDLNEQPMVISLPAVPDRYYVIPLLDAYTNQFNSTGTRTTGNGPGDYLIAGPRWSGRPPPGITQVIRAPTPTVWVIGRTLVRGPDDLSAAVAITFQYRLIPLDKYGTDYVPPSNVPVTNPEPQFIPPEGQPATAAEGFAEPTFFQAMQSVIAANPPPLNQRPLVASFRAVYANADLLTAQIVTAAQAAMSAALATSAKTVNEWSYQLGIGTYGEHYALRAGVALFGLGAVNEEDAVYASCHTDATGAPLDGSKGNYQIRFPSGQLPPVNPQAFWSITVYDQNGLLVENPINRYVAGSETGLVPDADGSVTIHLRNTAPPSSIPQANWLPVPDGPFNLTLRMYWPDTAALNTYEIPAVQIAGV